LTTPNRADATRASYDEWHARHPVDALADAPWHRLIQAGLDPSRDLAGKRLLDIGCGRGGFASWLARHPAAPVDVVGCDFSPVAVEKARRFAAESGVRHVRFEVADIQRLDQFADGTFDTVFSCETIEHVPDPPLAVRQLARVLKPGGRLFLTTPNYLSTIGAYRVYCWIRGKTFDEGGQPICQINMSPTTRRWVRRAGLRVLRTTGAGHYLPVPGRPPIEAPWMEHPRALMKWVAHHTLVVGEKPGAQGG
jgi:2-polyprenyl-6-hydroxyphenyl methylase/3-demethylubiquinone-9 3-methyltransferase